MINRLEAGASPEQVFDAAKLTISKHLLTGPLIPKKYQAQLADLVQNHTRLLSDSEYTLAMDRELNVLPGQKVSFDEELLESRIMAFSPGIVSGEPREIIVRKKAVERYTPSAFLFMLLEEVAHGYVPQPMKEPILSVPPSSLKLVPFESHDALHNHLEYVRQDIHQRERPVDMEKVSAVSLGFSTYIQEDAEGFDQPITYTSQPIQRAFEETRAIMVQSAFAAKILGSLRRPFGSLQEQLSLGFEEINTKDISMLHPMQHTGGVLVLEYTWNEKSIAKGVQDLVSSLYDESIDRFTESLLKRKPHVYNLFVNTVNDYLQVV